MEKNAAEYRAITKHLYGIALSIKNDLPNLSLKLIREELITPSQGNDMRNTSVNADKRAADFVGDILLNVIEQESVNFYKFVNILIGSGPTYKCIVEKLNNTLQEKQRENTAFKPGIIILYSIILKLPLHTMSCIIKTLRCTIIAII